MDQVGTAIVWIIIIGWGITDFLKAGQVQDLRREIVELKSQMESLDMELLRTCFMYADNEGRQRMLTDLLTEKEKGAQYLAEAAKKGDTVVHDRLFGMYQNLYRRIEYLKQLLKNPPTAGRTP